LTDEYFTLNIGEKMNSYEFEQVFKAKSRIVKILWFALTFPVLIYVLLIYYLADDLWASGVGRVDENFKYFFYAAGIGMFFTSLSLKKIFLSDIRLASQLKKDIKPEDLALNPQTKKVDPDDLAKMRSLSVRELKLIGLINWYLKPFLFQMAVNESITIMGMVLAILTQKEENIVPFAAVSLFLCAVTFLDLKKIVDRGKKILDEPSFYQFY